MDVTSVVIVPMVVAIALFMMIIVILNEKEPYKEEEVLPDKKEPRAEYKYKEPVPPAPAPCNVSYSGCNKPNTPIYVNYETDYPSTLPTANKMFSVPAEGVYMNFLNKCRR
jgi:hypothetical protein